ncbi:MAG: hypothetical protein R2991_11275 [Thermoanaerobaculia bacterium]
MSHGRNLVGAVVVCAALVPLATSAEVEIEQVATEGGKVVVTLVNRAETEARVQLRVGNQTTTVPVSDLAPGTSKSVVTDVELPCGRTQRVQASVMGAQGRPVTTSLSVPCEPSGGGGNGGGGGGGGSTGGGAPGIELSNLRVARTNGLLQADVKFLRPASGQTRVTLRFSYAGQSEDVVIGPQPVNFKRTVNTRSPFPCNTTETVRLEVTDPPDWAGPDAQEQLNRSCVNGQGTPNLVPVSLARTGAPLTNAIAETAVEVRVVVENDSDYNMPDNEMGGTPWVISVSGLNRAETVRHALLRHNNHSFTARINVPCWTREDDRYQDVTVKVDANDNILESNENDNDATYTIEKNRCRDAG